MSCFCCFWTRTFAHGPSRCSEVNTESLPCSSSWRPQQLRFSFYWLQNTCFQVIFKRDIGISSNMAFLQTQCCLCIFNEFSPFRTGRAPGDYSVSRLAMAAHTHLSQPHCSVAAAAFKRVCGAPQAQCWRPLLVCGRPTGSVLCPTAILTAVRSARRTSCGVWAP